MSRLILKQKTRVRPKYYDLFISYHPAQELQVERVCRIFRSHNLRVWFDLECMQSHLNSFDESYGAMQNSFIFVCFTSKKYDRNVRCRAEFSTAVEQKIDIIDLRLESFDFDLAKNLNQLNTVYIPIDFFDDKYKDFDENDFNEIVYNMKEMIEVTRQTYGHSNKRIDSFYRSIL